MRGAYPHLAVLLVLVLAACTVPATSRVNEEPPGKTHAHVTVFSPTGQPAPVSRVDRRIAGLGVWIDEVTGAPGNGNRALTRALRRELEATSLPIAISVGAASHFIQGVVDVRVKDATSEHVSIIWIVLDSDGKELGRVSQDNTIPRGILHEDWGDIARYAAVGGADGVLSIIEYDIVAE